jgi:hypothetical protein
MSRKGEVVLLSGSLGADVVTCRHPAGSDESRCLVCDHMFGCVWNVWEERLLSMGFHGDGYVRTIGTLVVY